MSLYSDEGIIRNNPLPHRRGKGKNMEQAFIKINIIRNKPFSAGAREKAIE